MKNALLNMELRSLIISELTQGKEMAKQLEINLNAPSSSSSSLEICDFLVNKIIDSYKRVLSMVKPVEGGDSDTISPRRDNTLLAVGEQPAGSPHSPIGSPRSQDSDMEIKDNYDKNISDASKKRKAMPRWTKQVQINPGSVSEGSLEDGHNWRKYGQKDILGAKYPRGYYRCRQRNAQGCLATKQVQRKDDNPTIFEITYRGRHTCSPRISSKSASSSPHPPHKQKEPTTKYNINNNNTDDTIDMHHQDQHALLLVPNFEAGQREEIANKDNLKNQDFPDDESPLNFPLSPNNVINVANYPFSTSLIHENLALDFPCPDYYTENLNFQITDDQEIMDKTSATTSSANSINVGLDYPFSIFANDFHIW